MMRRRQLLALEAKKKEESILAQAFKEAGIDIQFVDCKKAEEPSSTSGNVEAVSQGPDGSIKASIKLNTKKRRSRKK